MTRTPTVLLSEEEVRKTFEGVKWVRSRQNQMTASALGAGRIVRCAGGGPQEVRRDVGQRDHQSEKLTLLINIGSLAELEYRGRCASLPAGGLALIDGAQPCVLSLPTAYEQLIVEFPRSMIGRRHPDLLRSITAKPVAEEPASQILVQMALSASAAAPALADAARGHLADAMLSMLGTLTCAVSGKRSTAEQRLQRALANIDARLSDPDLCPAAIAGMQGISQRRLYAIFAECGLSVERVIWERRLDRAAAELADPSKSTHLLVDVALAWGFPSAAQFSRSFRARFGCSPSAYRQALASSTAERR